MSRRKVLREVVIRSAYDKAVTEREAAIEDNEITKAEKAYVEAELRQATEALDLLIDKDWGLGCIKGRAVLNTRQDPS